jgi:hypothetical protein
MTILIIETENLGHYLVGYMKYILRLFAKKNYKIIILTTKETSLHPSFNILKKENKNIKLEFVDALVIKKKNFLSLIIYQLKFFFLIKKKFKIINKKYKFDHVILNSFERFDKALSILGSPFGNVLFSGIFLGLKFHFKQFGINTSGRIDFFSKILFKRLLCFKTLKKILTNDPLLIKYLKKFNFTNFQKVNFLHEPKEFNYVYSKSKARKDLKIPLPSKALLVYGALINSKGIFELLKVLVHQRIRKDLCVVLAGTQSLEIKTLLNTNKIKNLIKNKRLLIFHGWQSEINEAKLFSASDLIWVGYKNYPIPSGVLYQASVKSLPVLVSNEGIINYFNKKYKLGLAVDLNNIDNLVFKINKILEVNNYKNFVINMKKFRYKANPKVWINSFERLVLN